MKPPSPRSRRGIAALSGDGENGGGASAGATAQLRQIFPLDVTGGPTPTAAAANAGAGQVEPEQVVKPANRLRRSAVARTLRQARPGPLGLAG